MIGRALKGDLVITDLKNPNGNILTDYLAFGVFVQAFIQQCHLSLLLLFVQRTVGVDVTYAHAFDIGNIAQFQRFGRTVDHFVFIVTISSVLRETHRG